MHRRAFVFITTIAVAVLTVGGLALSNPAMAAPVGPSGNGFAPCDDAGTTVSCSAVELGTTAAWRGHHTEGAAAATPTPPGYGPTDLAHAYNLTAAGLYGGRGKTVAIVDAYDDPYALSDLSAYRSQYGLPPICHGFFSRGCVTFSKVNQKGGTSPLPAPDPGWSEEISVDVDMVSAVCPNCNILLVEADAATLQSLGKAEDAAAEADPVSIGNSWGTGEWNAETAFDGHFTHPGIAITAAAGDNGYGVQWPASSPNVVAVGGTTLSSAAGSSRGWSEAVWSGDGSGCSTVEPQPSWQHRVSALRSNCAERAVADVAAVADPNTGVAVYDTYELPGWAVFGGTSVSTQIISAVYGLASDWRISMGASGLYAASPSNFFDVTNGSNATCGSDLCTAAVGWDGPTGLGTPNGVAAF